jgi:hypothetical protein
MFKNPNKNVDDKHEHQILTWGGGGGGDACSDMWHMNYHGYDVFN